MRKIKVYIFYFPFLVVISILLKSLSNPLATFQIMYVCKKYLSDTDLRNLLRNKIIYYTKKVS